MRLASVAGLSLLVAASAAGQVDLAFDGEQLKVPSPELHLFFARQPVVVDGAIMVPLSAIEGWLKTAVQRSEGGNRLAIRYYGQTATAIDMQMWIGRKQAVLGRLTVPLDAAPLYGGSKVYVPLRFIAEAVGVWVDAIDHRVRLKKPDLNWECWLAIPPHPKSLEGKMLALALARKPDSRKRVEDVRLSADTMAGQVLLAEPPDDSGKPVRTVLTFRRDRSGWHFASGAPFTR